jgi:hypothetical protein
VAAALDEDGIGFGYGALAAGADILIAEALLARGAALHVVLPVREVDFVAQSVMPYGEAWLPRFRACLAQASSVHEATGVAGAYEPLATALAGDMAMGAALLNARALESSAVQLLVIDEGDGPYGDGAYTARDGAAWAAAGHPQRAIRSARNGVAASSRQAEGRADRRLMAMLHVSFEGLDALDDGDYVEAWDGAIRPWLAHCDAGADHIQAWGNARLFGFADAGRAAAFALRLHALDPPAPFAPVIAGHYGLVYQEAGVVRGPAFEALVDLHFAALPGSVTVSDPFATALAIGDGGALRTEFLGEHHLLGSAGEVRLFALLSAQ